ncbi:MAG: LicD family protein [Lachnospiraceae bacterium]|nr:LicD family protein [Lachnospiraceae bacterium]
MIEFKREFFEDEVRDGFFIASEMKCAWAAEMEIVMEIDRICQKHGITYFADSGTLLGAVRHNGFIPWDDDLDIAMKREDYNKFASVVAQEIPDTWMYLSSTAHPEWDQPFARLVNGAGLNFSSEHLERFHGCPYLVGVDIFPLDYLPGNGEANEEIDTIISLIYQIKYAKVLHEKHPDRKEEMEEVVAELEEICRFKFDREKSLMNQLTQLTEKLFALYSPEECGVLANISFIADADEFRAYVNTLKNKEWYRESVRLPFENITLPVPIDYHQVLTKSYGPNYMTPVKKWDFHNYPFYKGQKEWLRKAQADSAELKAKLDQLEAELEKMGKDADTIDE